MRAGTVVTGAYGRWLAPLAVGLAALAIAAPAQAAFPGKPGPIAYSRVKLSEFGDTGGLFSHGPRKRDPTQRLTTDVGDSSPAFSPDGRLIAFESNREPGETAGSHIFVMNRDGSGVRQLTSGAVLDSNPSFSPNSKRIVFDRGEPPGRIAHIFSVAVDGSDLRQISRGDRSDTDPTFTPDGRRIVFVTNRSAAGRRDRANIFSMRPDGTRLRLLIGGPREEYDPDVSPNGLRIAFASNRSHGPNVFTARLDGKDVRQLTHSRRDCFSGACYTDPAWAPSGKHIALLSRGRYSSGVDVIRADGGGVSKEFAGGGTEPEGFGSRVGAPGWGSLPR